MSDKVTPISKGEEYRFRKEGVEVRGLQVSMAMFEEGDTVESCCCGNEAFMLVRGKDGFVRPRCTSCGVDAEIK